VSNCVLICLWYTAAVFDDFEVMGSLPDFGCCSREIALVKLKQPFQSTTIVISDWGKCLVKVPMAAVYNKKKLFTI